MPAISHCTGKDYVRHLYLKTVYEKKSGFSNWKTVLAFLQKFEALSSLEYINELSFKLKTREDSAKPYTTPSHFTRNIFISAVVEMSPNIESFESNVEEFEFETQIVLTWCKIELLYYMKD